MAGCILEDQFGAVGIVEHPEASDLPVLVDNVSMIICGSQYPYENNVT